MKRRGRRPLRRCARPRISSRRPAARPDSRRPRRCWSTACTCSTSSLSSRPRPQDGPMWRANGSGPRRCYVASTGARPMPRVFPIRPIPPALPSQCSAAPCPRRPAGRSGERRRGGRASRFSWPRPIFKDGDAMTSRREFLALSAGLFAVAGLPGAVFAAAPGEERFVLVLLRGALDGLAAVPPLGDPRYAEKRGALALDPAACVALDHGFALNPALKILEPYYRKGELLIVPASGNGYRTRSHFDAQDLMECGLGAKTRETDGWLNRALTLVQRGDKRLGLAVGGAVPLVLRGAVPVASWEPANFHPAN